MSTEAAGWLKPDKLTEVIDIFDNSQLNVAQRSITYGHGSRVVKPLKAGMSGGVGTTATPPQTVGNMKPPVTGNPSWRCFRCGKFGHTARFCRSNLPVFTNSGQNKPKVESKGKQEAKVNRLAVESTSGPITLSDELSHVQVFSSSKVDVRIPDAEFYRELDQEIGQIYETAANCDAAYTSCMVDGDDRTGVLLDKPARQVREQTVEGGVAVSDVNTSGDQKHEFTPNARHDVSFDNDESTVIYPLMSVEQDDNSSLTQNDSVPVELSALQYCEVELALLDRPVKVLKDGGAQICLVKPSTLEGLDLPCLGEIAIRGIIGSPVEVPLVTLQIRPYPGLGFESIAPFIDVTFGVCDMTMEVEMILSDLVVRQLDALNVYTVVKPTVVVNNRSEEIQTPPQVCEAHVDADASSSGQEDEVIAEGDSNDDDDNTYVKSLTSSPQVADNAEAKRLRDEQRIDISLKGAWLSAEKGKGNFYVKDDLLYHRDKVMGLKVDQLCVPTSRREEICHSAHDLAHQGYKRTKERIQQNFFWPKMNKTVKEYVTSCLECQQKARAVVKDRIPISVVPRGQIPFSHIYMDCIGPLFDKAEYNYCLCVVDSHTRYPFAFPLRAVNAKSVCDCLLQIFSLVGISSVITSDQGTCFTAKLTQEFMKMFGCSPRFSTPLHPEGNSLVERANQNIKKILAHVCKDHPKQWHKVLPLVLWCIREARSEVLGVSPYMMLLGRAPSNPLKLIKESWTGENQIPSTVGKSVSEYLSELQTKLKDIHDFAESHAAVEQQRYVNQYNKKARQKEFQLRQQVIVLIPDSTNKLLKKWQGPATIVEKKSNSYLIELDHGQRRWLHANLLRPYHPRVDQAVINNCSIVYDEDEDFGSLPVNSSPPFDDKVPSQRVEDAKLAHLTSEQKQEFLSLLDEFADVFITKPGLCKFGVHEINVTPDFKPKRLRAYRIPELLKPEVSRQIQELLDLGFIRPSDSEMASPVVCVLKGRKGEGGVRLCCDYRYLNKFTRGDAYPTSDISDVIHKVGRASHISTWDTRSGYWQLLVKPEHRWLTAFVTDFGVFEWVRMPFGLKCASNSFIRAVQRILQPISDFNDSYVDDLATFSNDWATHLAHVRSFLTVIRESGLTLKLEKCRFAMPKVTFVGHVIGSGTHAPDPNKVACVQTMKIPATKKEVRQMLGFFSYFRTYIDGFAEIAKPLSDLTKKQVPNRLQWTSVHQQAFDLLKTKLCAETELHVINYGQPCGILVDASNMAVGCCLIQWAEDNSEKPIAFASTKLNHTQVAWSTIEKEAYAVMFALRKFRNFIFLAKISIFSDHNPLLYLKECAPKSAKLTRWALGLQEFDITWHFRPGSKNQAADTLSRLG